MGGKCVHGTVYHEGEALAAIDWAALAFPDETLARGQCWIVLYRKRAALRKSDIRSVFVERERTAA